MTSPGPDAPGPESRPPKSPKDNEQETQVNGHAPPDESDAKSKPEKAIESRGEDAQANAKEKREARSTESSDKEKEKPAVNGERPQEDSSAADAADVGSKDAPTKDKADASDATRSEQEPAPATAETPAKSPETNKPDAPASQSKDEPKSEAEKPAEKPDEAEKGDVEMTDPPAAKEDAAEPAARKETTPSANTTKEPALDQEMKDSPPEEGDKPSKPSDTGKAVPSTGDSANPPTSEVDLGPASMSQLAIASTEKASSPVSPSADVSMTDAPSAKVARERDEDAGEEPAPKRARTEPMDDAPDPAPTDAPTEPPAEASAPGQEAQGIDGSTLTKLTRWEDPETIDKPISPFQRREIRKVIGRVRKTKSGLHFRDSVQKLWPGLWDSYLDKIDKPMDLGEIERTMRGDDTSPIVTFGDLRANLSLVFDNTLVFNGDTHHVTAAAAQAVGTVWEDCMAIPVEEPTRPKAAPKAKPVRESRTVSNVEATARRQSAGPTASPSVDSAAAPAAATAAAAPAANPPPPAAAPEPPTAPPAADRRGSAATEGDRPKRTVRAPKPKDIDYTTKPSRKKLKPELQFCDEVLTELMHPRNGSFNQWFLDRVDAEGLNIPTYYSVIKKPMDLGKVQRMLSGGEITSIKDFDKNVRLIFENCYRFNGPPAEQNQVSLLCKKLEDVYVAQMKTKDSWMSKHAAKTSAPAASASNASDDEDGDEDDGDEAADPVADNKEIEELQAKLDEETKKLNGMLLGGNQNLIDIQKGIVDMVQNALIKAAQAAQQARAKKEKASKKSGKGGKAKASGGSGGRKSTGGASQPKKSGGSKKAAAKKSLTVVEKDQIASAINDLEFPHLERAIDIIKKDTGQNENNDGELELDIDQLSNEALFKLWDLCKKALPGFGKDSAAAPNTSPDVNRGASAKQAPKTAAKPKKNKPMSAQEQEARIVQLRDLRDLYSGQEPAEAPKVTQAPTPTADSSDDSDSEED